MKKFLNGMGFLLICILEILVGVIIIFNPMSFARAVIVVVGIGLAVGGIVNIIVYFRSDPLIGSMGMRLFNGLIYLAIGAAFIVSPQKILNMLPMISVLFAAALLISAVYKIQITADTLRLGRSFWYIPLISAVISAAFAAIIFFDPFAAAGTLWLFIGVCCIVEGIIDIFSFFAGKVSNKSGSDDAYECESEA